MARNEYGEFTLGWLGGGRWITSRGKSPSHLWSINPRRSGG